MTIRRTSAVHFAASDTGRAAAGVSGSNCASTARVIASHSGSAEGSRSASAMRRQRSRWWVAIASPLLEK
ncbi:hypothetical protein [Streptomyces sp. NPDC017529]|uniref:hypothetical protein n=1 Tax=Streptomyces sp. NPDC017529 TaxID=3365000 RepID=UPI0037949C73